VGNRRLVRSSTVAGLTGGVVLTFATSPWPSALVIRQLLERTSPARTLRAGSTAGVTSITDEQYLPGQHDARLDIYFPTATGANERLPAVVWVHGGAWISGHKEDAAPYFEMLALEGYAVIAVEYSRAPRTKYPTPLRQINDAIAYACRHADRFHIDDGQILVAGDSAGAQMSSQIAALVTNPDYASQLGIIPSLRPDQLRGVILFCGVYDANSTARHDQPLPDAVLQLFVASVLWAYTGSRDRNSATLRQMSTIDHATPDFPPTFISGGNADPFTDAHSRPFATRLAELGVDVTTLFYPRDHTPALGHEYQFRTESAAAQAALEALLDFINRIAG
jgi:acetyl esterase